MHLGIVAAAVFFLNIPFGYWRANVPRRSAAWFLAIHLPIPVIVILRLYSGIGFVWFSYPVLVGTFFIGQLFGGRLKLWLAGCEPARGSSCIFRDVAGEKLQKEPDCSSCTPKTGGIKKQEKQAVCEDR